MFLQYKIHIHLQRVYGLARKIEHQSVIIICQFKLAREIASVLMNECARVLSIPIIIGTVFFHKLRLTLALIHVDIHTRIFYFKA